MEKVILQLQEGIATAAKLCLNMQNAVNYASNITREADENLKKAADMELAVEVKEKNLAERSEKVARIENLVALEAECKKLAEQNKVATAKLEQAAIAFNAETIRVTKEITAAKHKVENETEMIAKEWAALKKEQESWKAKWLEEIKNKVK